MLVNFFKYKYETVPYANSLHTSSVFQISNFYKFSLKKLKNFFLKKIETPLFKYLWQAIWLGHSYFNISVQVCGSSVAHIELITGTIKKHNTSFFLIKIYENGILNLINLFQRTAQPGAVIRELILLINSLLACYLVSTYIT